MKDGLNVENCSPAGLCKIRPAVKKTILVKKSRKRTETDEVQSELHRGDSMRTQKLLNDEVGLLRGSTGPKDAQGSAEQESPPCRS